MGKNSRIKRESLLKLQVEKLEKKVILRELKKNRWNRSKTAIALGLSRKGLYKKILRYGLNELIVQGQKKV